MVVRDKRPATAVTENGPATAVTEKGEREWARTRRL